MKKARYEPYFYIAPAFFLVAVLLYYPIVMNFLYSFHSFKAYSSDMTFVGLKNYLTLLTDSRFLTAISNNLIFLVLNLIFQVGVALLLAILVENLSLIHIFLNPFHRVLLRTCLQFIRIGRAISERAVYHAGFRSKGRRGFQAFPNGGVRRRMFPRQGEIGGRKAG